MNKMFIIYILDGRQTWEYRGNDFKQTIVDKYWLGTLNAAQKKSSVPRTVKQSATDAFDFYSQLQTEDGHMAGEYGQEYIIVLTRGGPMFLIPGLVITMFITGAEYKPRQKEELVRYIKNRAHLVDGGWGM